jgi:predicted signal transduction protein with EAL and GGDEF domain
MASLTLWQRLWPYARAMIEARDDDDDRLRDSLTWLPGVDAVRERLGEWLGEQANDAARDGEGARVHGMLLGLRRFDAINLAFGAAVGDLALAEVGMRLSHFAAQELDGQWIAARSGGGNFLLIAEEPCSRERWQLVAEQLADFVAKPISAPSGMLRLSPRVALVRGLAGEGPDSLLDRLGQTLAVAQRQQGRRVAWGDGSTIRVGRSAALLEADLLGAIDRDEIEILFQPQFALPGDRLGGAEALARWNHPRLGRIGAGALFTIAERADHVAPLSLHIAAKSLAVARDWPAHLRLSLNVTSADLAARSYADALLAVIAEQGCPAGRLTLEVTEQVLLHDIHLAGRMLSQLAGHGIRIALDARAHALDLQVIAEGIESEDQRAVIEREGCASYQGFLRSAPVSAAAFAAMAAG